LNNTREFVVSWYSFSYIYSFLPLRRYPPSELLRYHRVSFLHPLVFSPFGDGQRTIGKFSFPLRLGLLFLGYSPIQSHFLYPVPYLSRTFSPWSLLPFFHHGTCHLPLKRRGGSLSLFSESFPFFLIYPLRPPLPLSIRV